MNSGLTSHQQRGHTETGPRFKVSSERPEKRGIDLATPGLVVQRVIHYTTAAPREIRKIVPKLSLLSLLIRSVACILCLSPSNFFYNTFKHGISKSFQMSLFGLFFKQIIA